MWWPGVEIMRGEGGWGGEPGLYLPEERNFKTVGNVIELSELHGFGLMNYQTNDLAFCCVPY